jgi:GMP synthase (glutamine-hydrolysing)
MTEKREVIVLQHEQVEGLGTIAEALSGEGILPRYSRAHAGDSIPKELGGSAGLIVMGGPMGVYEASRYPFLRDELRLIEKALARGAPVLGICLGSQLVAHALGAEVRPSGGKEIGWYPVRLREAAATDPLWKGTEPSFTAFHWHGDFFALPKDAIHLASSDFSPFQAYRSGTAYGFLFHLEATEAIVQDMVRAWPRELADEKLDGAAIVGGAKEHLSSMRSIARRVFGRFASLLKLSVSSSI